MINDSNSGFNMPVVPAYGNNGGLGGDFGWLLLGLLFGWGGMGGFGGMMGGWGGFGGYDFPWLLNGQNMINANTNAGFDHAATQAALGDLSTAVTAGFGNVQNSLCGGFAGVNAAVNGAQNTITQQMYTNQIADLERSYAAQTANTAGLTNIATQIANEGCSTRATNTANSQAILDKLCQLELDNYKNQLDNKNDTIAQLRQEVLYAKGQASQVEQTAKILAGQTAEVDALYNRLDSCPVGTTPVYGRTPIFSCNNNGGCGCNNGFYN